MGPSVTGPDAVLNYELEVGDQGRVESWRIYVQLSLMSFQSDTLGICPAAIEQNHDFTSRP
jgi:hypothetical protein